MRRTEDMNDEEHVGGHVKDTLGDTLEEGGHGRVDIARGRAGHYNFIGNSCPSPDSPDSLIAVTIMGDRIRAKHATRAPHRCIEPYRALFVKVKRGHREVGGERRNVLHPRAAVPGTRIFSAESKRLIMLN